MSKDTENNVWAGHGTDPSIVVLVGQTGVEKQVDLVGLCHVPAGVNVGIGWGADHDPILLPSGERKS